MAKSDPSPSSSSSSSNSSATAPTSQPKASNTPAPSTTSTPPPQSPPPPVAASPPPSPPLSPPPAATPPPASPPSSPPPSPPPSPPTSPPPSPPPVASSPPPPVSSPPPPLQVSSPPPSVAASPPPPSTSPSPPSANSPPPPPAKAPVSSPPPPASVSPAPKSSPSPTASTSPPPSSSNSSLSPVPPAAAASPSNSTVNGTKSIAPVPSASSGEPTPKASTSSPSGGGTKNSSGGISTGGAAAIGIVGGLIALSLLLMAVWFARKRKRHSSGLGGVDGMASPYASSQGSGSVFLRPQKLNHPAGSASGNNFMYSPEPGGVGNTRSWFTYEELTKATNGFSAQNLLGEGGFGCVYKGLLLDGREVAVKQLKIGGGQGEREFRAEVEIISRVHHRHLVTLVGYCISDHQRLLVYEYVPNDTLHYHLHGKGRPAMEWSTRVKVAAGAARGIAYLHEDCHPRIIHRDIKSTNILLDNSFEARVADFGLAKLALDANTHVTTRVMGTFGYMAPEYASSGKLTEKSDVFSFGVVLLELITGRKPVDASQPLGDESLVEWARPLLAQVIEGGSLEELIDPRLENNYVTAEMLGMIQAAAVCIRHLASKRPRMSQVVRALDTIGELSDITNGMKPGQSEVFNSREQSAQIRMFQRMAFGSQDISSSEFFDRSHSSWQSRESRE